MSERPNITTAKQKARAKLEADTAAFLANGGQIKQVPSTHRGFENEIAFFLGKEKHEKTKRKAARKAKNRAS